jgi:hypothetical protein
MRLPALAGALLFLVSVWRLARYALGRGWLCLLAVAVAGLNPFVLDYLSAARGYSLALGFFFWGLFLLTRYLAEDYDPPVRLLFRAGVAMGLAVAANLVFLVPATAAGCAATALLVPRRAGIWTLVDRFWGPALVLAFLFWVLPLAHAEASNFYYGARSLEQMVHSLAVPSLLHDERVYRLGAGRWVNLAIRFVLPALAAVVVAGVAAGAWRWFRRRDSSNPALLLLGSTMALSFAAHPLSTRADRDLLAAARGAGERVHSRLALELAPAGQGGCHRHRRGARARARAVRGGLHHGPDSRMALRRGHQADRRHARGAARRRARKAGAAGGHLAPRAILELLPANV